MKIREKILVIEDEQTIRNFMQAVLTANDYDVLLARTGAMGESMIASHCPDVIILDLGLPDVDGMEILRKVRRWSKVPIVVVSARTHERDKVEALDAGADDYLTKPFGTGELLARIRAAIRHTRTPIGSEAVANTGIFKAGELTIDYAKHRVFIAGQDANLTQNEYKLVALLGLHAGKVDTSSQHINAQFADACAFVWISDFAAAEYAIFFAADCAYLSFNRDAFCMSQSNDFFCFFNIFFNAVFGTIEHNGGETFFDAFFCTFIGTMVQMQSNWNSDVQLFEQIGRASCRERV